MWSELTAAAAAAANEGGEREVEVERKGRGGRRKMSGNGVKKVAEVAAKAGKAIDWEGMAKMLVSDEARKEFNTLRRTFEDVNHQLQTKFSQVFTTPPPHTRRRRIGPRVSGSGGHPPVSDPSDLVLNAKIPW